LLSKKAQYQIFLFPTKFSLYKKWFNWQSKLIKKLFPFSKNITSLQLNLLLSGFAEVKKESKSNQWNLPMAKHNKSSKFCSRFLSLCHVVMYGGCCWPAVKHSFVTLIDNVNLFCTYIYFNNETAASLEENHKAGSWHNFCHCCNLHIINKIRRGSQSKLII